MAATIGCSILIGIEGLKEEPETAMLDVIVIQTSLCCAGLCATAHQSDSPRWVDTAAATDWRASTFSASAQAEAAIDVDEHDEVTVVWASRRQQDGRSGVFMQRFDHAGEAIGSEQRINVWTNSHEVSPDVDSANGLTWIVWQSHGRDGDGAAIMARMFRRAAHGELIGGDEILVNQEWIGDQISPVVSAAHDGSALIAWTSTSAIDGLPRAKARVFDATGGTLTDEFEISARDGTSTSLPSVCFGSDGHWMAAFSRADPPRRVPAGIAMRRFDVCGRALGDDIVLRDAAGGIEPVIAAANSSDDQARYMVAWCSPTSGQQDASYRVMAQAIDVNGSAMGDAHFAHTTTGGLHNAPAIVADVDGFVVAWNHSIGGEVDIVARRFERNGEPAGEMFSMHQHREHSQSLRAAAGTNRIESNSRGDLLCAWNGDGGFGDDSAAHMSLVARAPVARGADGTLVNEEGHATRQVDAGANGEVVAQPHEPPVFDRRLIDKAAREPAQVGVDEIGFVGILSTGWTPPDPHLAVGPDHLVAITNGEIAFFTKTGTLLFQDEIEGLGGFWGSVGATTFVFDPEVLFDEDAGRYFAMASETISTQSKSYVLIAVSDDADPMGTWHKYRIETTALAGTTFDSPNISVDGLLVYVTGDRAGSVNAYPVYVFSKLAMMAGNPAPIVHSMLMPTTTESAGIPPVNLDGTQALYFIEHGEAVSNTTVRLIAMTNQITSPTFTSILMDVPAYGLPEDPPQMGTTVRPETFDARFWSVAYRNGSLWATHHINSDRVIVRWYEFKMNNWPMSGKLPELVQSGNIDPGGTARTFFSAITVDGDNNAAIVFSRSSPSEFISMQTAYRYASDPPGTFQTPITRQTNVGPYTTNRWGDYGGINVDPVDGLTMWAHHEYSVNNSWRTWIQSFYPGNPCPPDINADGEVDVDDLLAVINAWGFCLNCPEDISPPEGNLVVDVDDLLYVINSWGGCF